MVNGEKLRNLVGCVDAARSVGIKTFGGAWKRLVSFCADKEKYRESKDIGLHWRDLFYDLRKGVSELSQYMGACCTYTNLAFIGVLGLYIISIFGACTHNRTDTS